jgi:hypothetical protein
MEAISAISLGPTAPLGTVGCLGSQMKFYFCGVHPVALLKLYYHYMIVK